MGGAVIDHLRHPGKPTGVRQDLDVRSGIDQNPNTYPSKPDAIITSTLVVAVLASLFGCFLRSSIITIEM